MRRVFRLCLNAGWKKKMKTRYRESYFETNSGWRFWCSQGWIRHLVQFFGLRFMFEVMLRYTLRSDFGAPKVELDIRSDFLIQDLCVEIYCGILWKAILVLPRLNQTSGLIVLFRIYVWRYVAGERFWCCQGWIGHLVWFFGLRFIFGDILQNTLGNEFGRSQGWIKHKSDFRFEIYWEKEELFGRSKVWIKHLVWFFCSRYSIFWRSYLVLQFPCFPPRGHEQEAVLDYSVPMDLAGAWNCSWSLDWSLRGSAGA